MVQRRIPLTIYRPARAGVYSFATLAALEAAARAIVISVYPVLLLRALGDAKNVSLAYFAVGLVSMIIALFTPFLASLFPRRWIYTGGLALMIAGNLVAILSDGEMVFFSLLANTAALVIMTVCFNAYVMDYIERTSLGKNETARLVFSGMSWTAGPFLGVWLMDKWLLAPFYLAIIAAMMMMAFFWFLRLGDGKAITRAKRPPANPLVYLPSFFRQKLLLSGWLFSVMRSIGWQIYIVYLPIFAVQNGLGEQLGGMMLSISNGFLFLAPLIYRFIVSKSVRFSIFLGFSVSGILFIAASMMTVSPQLVVIQMLVATLFLVILDVSAGLPFLMSVKPSERTQMSAVYSTFRDVSAVATPGVAWVILAFAPIAAIFSAGGAGLLACASVALKLHPRLGKKKIAPNPA